MASVDQVNSLAQSQHNYPVDVYAMTDGHFGNLNWILWHILLS